MHIEDLQKTIPFCSMRDSSLCEGYHEEAACSAD